MTDYLEGALPEAARARFEHHLPGCDGCTAYLEQMRATVGALGHLPPDRLPAGVLDELVAVYRHRC